MSSSSFNDLGNIDAVVSRDVLVPYSPGYTEAETWTRTRGRQALSTTGHCYCLYVLLCTCYVLCLGDILLRVPVSTCLVPLGPFTSLISTTRSQAAFLLRM